MQNCVENVAVIIGHFQADLACNGAFDDVAVGHLDSQILALYHVEQVGSTRSCL